jgi:hypothetical protein
MSMMPARVTQADVARCLRAARAAGARAVEVRPDGTIFVHLDLPQGGKPDQAPALQLEDDEIVVL